MAGLAHDSFPKVVRYDREPILRILDFLGKFLIILGILLQVLPRFLDGSVLRGTPGAFLLIVPEAVQVERVHAHEVHRREIEGEATVGALADLEDPGVCSEILNLFLHGFSVLLRGGIMKNRSNIFYYTRDKRK